MHRLHWNGPGDELRSAMFLGAHCDDIEIGCGATVLRLARENPGIDVRWIVFSSGETRAAEARAAAERFLRGFERYEVIIQDFRNGFFPYVATEIKEFIESLKAGTAPDVIFTQYGRDLHQDHRLLSELTWNTFRNHMILEYEIPKYDGGMGSPNLFVPVEPDLCDEKIAGILDSFPSQHDKPWFTDDTFRAVMRLRGVESNAPSGFAEAFYCRKLVV